MAPGAGGGGRRLSHGGAAGLGPDSQRPRGARGRADGETLGAPGTPPLCPSSSIPRGNLRHPRQPSPPSREVGLGGSLSPQF